MTDKTFLFSAPEGLEHYWGTRARIDMFLDRCEEVGISRLTPAIVSTAPPSPLFPYLTEAADKRGISVIVYKAIGWGGNHEWIYHSNAGEPAPEPDIHRFARMNPNLWSRTREDKVWLNYHYSHMLGKLGFLDFSHPAVTEFEWTIFRHYLEYGARGIQFEWVPSARLPDDTEERQHTIDWALDDLGEWGYGYDPKPVADFIETYGVDPRSLPSSDERWRRHRSSYVTNHVAQIANAARQLTGDIEISLQGVCGTFLNPEAGLRVGLDWEGIVDAGIVDAIYPRWPAEYPRLEFAWTSETTTRFVEQVSTLTKLLAGRAELMAGLLLPTYAFLSKDTINPHAAAEALVSAANRARQAGAAGVGIYRADRLDALGLWSLLDGFSTRG